MIINAVIESKDGGTLVLDFPRSIYDVYEKLQSVGIRQSPHQITLSDEEGDDVRVKLYSEDETGKHLLLTLKEQNSLADANMLAFMVDNAKPDFRSKLEQNLLNDQYSSMQEVTDDIKQMLYESGPVKAVFYCPLVGEVTDEEGFSSPVDGRFLKSYAWAVEEALEADTADDEMDMAEFFDEDDGVKAKLVSAKWGVETYRGQLFGRIECSLKEELTDAETEILTDWISGQNSDGYGEHFEQQPIDTEDGDLYVSFWNSGDNYSIMTRDELDEYIVKPVGAQKARIGVGAAWRKGAPKAKFLFELRGAECRLTFIERKNSLYLVDPERIFRVQKREESHPNTVV